MYIRCCFDIPVDCETCYKMTLSFCPDNPINISAGLTPGQSLFLWIRDKMNNLFMDEITANGDGSFDIDMGNFPAGMFTNSFGPVDLFLTDDIDGENVVPMTFDMVAYNCIILSVDPPNFFINEPGTCLFVSESGECFTAE